MNFRKQERNTHNLPHMFYNILNLEYAKRVHNNQYRQNSEENYNFRLKNPISPESSKTSSRTWVVDLPLTLRVLSPISLNQSPPYARSFLFNFSVRISNKNESMHKSLCFLDLWKIRTEPRWWPIKYYEALSSEYIFAITKRFLQRSIHAWT